MVKFRRGVVLTRDSADKRKKERGHQNEKPENYSRASARGLRRGQMFADETMLFAQTWFRHAEIFRDMDNDYGMVCMPKFLESSDYMTLVYDGTTVFVPPITSR